MNVIRTITPKPHFTTNPKELLYICSLSHSNNRFVPLLLCAFFPTPLSKIRRVLVYPAFLEASYEPSNKLVKRLALGFKQSYISHLTGIPQSAILA